MHGRQRLEEWVALRHAVEGREVHVRLEDPLDLPAGLGDRVVVQRRRRDLHLEQRRVHRTERSHCRNAKLTGQVNNAAVDAILVELPQVAAAEVCGVVRRHREVEGRQGFDGECRALQGGLGHSEFLGMGLRTAISIKTTLIAAAALMAISDRL